MDVYIYSYQKNKVLQNDFFFKIKHLFQKKAILHQGQMCKIQEMGTLVSY